MFGANIEKKEGDPRIARALQQLDIKYEISDEGDFRFGFDLEGRTQIGIIHSETYDFAGVEMREVVSVGLKSFGPFDARTAGILLAENSRLKLGGWGIVCDSEDNHLAIFSAKIAADLSGNLLLEVLNAVITTADHIEQRLSGRDDF